eukprot:COSAG01_NODE_596_length_15055_cov_17.624967_2_plen_424_part_00
MIKESGASGMASAGGDPGDPVAKWEAATSSRAQHLGVPTSDILQSPTSIPYVVELVGVSGLPAVAPHRARVSLYHGGSRTFFGRTWEGPSLGQRIFLHTRVVDSSCSAVVEVVRETDTGAVSAGWALIPLFGRRLHDLGGPSVLLQVPLCPGTPRYLLYGAEVPASGAASTGSLQVKMWTHLAALQHTSLLRENEFVSMDYKLPGLAQGLATPTPVPTCDVTLSRMQFSMADAAGTGDTGIAKLHFEPALMKCLESIGNIEQWRGSTGVNSARALVGIHNGHKYIKQRLCISLSRRDESTSGSGWGTETPTVLSGVPLDPGIAIVVCLQLIVDSSGSSAAGSESTALLLGWITLCPCQDGAPAAAELEAPLNRGPEPSPDGELALSWGDLDAYDEVENNQVRFCRARSTIPLLTFAHDCTCVV